MGTGTKLADGFCMGHFSPFSNRMKRYAGAAIAAIVTTVIAMSTLSAEAETCSLHEATRWQLALSDPLEEQSPEYVRSVTEAFLSACPNRPEGFEARKIAGMAAVDMGDPQGAVRHFREAGMIREVKASFYAMAAYLGAGEPAAAWQQRDQMVVAWHRRLERHSRVSISSEPVANGMIYQLHFADTDRMSRTRAAWVAVPDGPGWPATLSFSKDRFRVSLHKTRAGDDAKDKYFVDLHRCTGRRGLGQIEAKMSSTDFDDTARASLIAYLANPDRPEPARKDQVQPCAWPGRLLPGAPKP